MQRIYVPAVLFAALTAPAIAHAQTLTEPVDLLHRTGAQIGVSSEVENPTDMPDALVDGDPSKAWQSRTGDLKGAWVAFRVAPDARIQRIGLVPGVAKKTDALDLFTANHRLTKVRLTEYESGKLVGDFTLDPSKPELQYISLDLPGGAYKLTVTGVLAGSKKAWRELPVGEFTVEGTPGSDAPGAVSVYVGPLGVRAQLPHVLEPRATKPREACTDDISEECVGYGNAWSAGSVSRAPYMRLVSNRWFENGADVTQLAVRTTKSWFDLPFTRNEIEHCGHGDWVTRSVEDATIRGPYLVIRTRTINGSFPLDEHMQPVGEIWSYSCDETTSVCHASGPTLACQHFTTATAKPRKLNHPLDESKVTWTPATKLSFAKDGTLVVTLQAPSAPMPASK